MKKLFLSCSLLAGLVGSASAIDIGVVQLSPEVGVSVSVKSSTYKIGEGLGVGDQDIINKTRTDGVLGGYARLWVGAFGFVVAPQFAVNYYQIGGYESSEDYTVLTQSDGAGGSMTTKIGTQSVADVINYQYGLLLGKNFDTSVVRFTPYIGFNGSSFSDIQASPATILNTFGVPSSWMPNVGEINIQLSSTVAYQVGLKVKPSIIPLAVSLQYTYQSPNILFEGNKIGSVQMHDVTLLLGLHF